MVRSHWVSMGLFLLATIVGASDATRAEDWPQFRGLRGMGTSAETGLPVEWGEQQNLAWKTPLPGEGSSSPIVLGDRLFVTCFSGYGLESGESGTMDDLMLHVLCVDSTDGRIPVGQGRSSATARVGACAGPWLCRVDSRYRWRTVVRVLRPDRGPGDRPGRKRAVASGRRIEDAWLGHGNFPRAARATRDRQCECRKWCPGCPG